MGQQHVGPSTAELDYRDTLSKFRTYFIIAHCLYNVYIITGIIQTKTCEDAKQLTSCFKASRSMFEDFVVCCPLSAWAVKVFHKLTLFDLAVTTFYKTKLAALHPTTWIIFPMGDATYEYPVCSRFDLGKIIEATSARNLRYVYLLFFQRIVFPIYVF